MDSPPRSACAGLSPNSLAMHSPFIESPPALNPPISVVFVAKAASKMPRSVINPTTSPLKSPDPRLNSSFGSATATTSMTPPTSGNFRLQPRHSLKCTPQTQHQGSSESGRGRKRRAGSLNDVPAKSEVGLKSQNPKSQNSIFEWSTGWKTLSQNASPEDSPNATDATGLNLQSLSIHSPKGPSPPRPPKLRNAESQQSHFLSSFSRFSHSPSHSVARVASSTEDSEESKPDEGLTSPALSSVVSSSSPKLMPLKVLLHNDPNTPLSARPPLANTPVSACSLPREEGNTNEEYLLLPCALTRNSPDNSLSTIHDPDSANDDPPQKQRRTRHFESPHSKTRTPRTPRVPKINLTPRSDRLSAYSHSEDLPMFPSPSEGLPPDEELANDSSEILINAYEQERMRSSHAVASSTLAPSRPASFIPVPDWAETTHTMSWLYGNEADDNFAGMFPDNGSLSDDESHDAAFVLASPAVIAEEKNTQANAKQRRLQPGADSTGHLSSTSLLGINFVPSNGCLATMDNKIPGNLFLRFPTKPSPSNDLGIPRSESHSSVGLTLEIPQTTPQGRDLVTPPTLPQPKDPPPLSPHCCEEN